MRGQGEIIETPITANFKEGLTVMDYFNSTHGARKGLADTALKTANSGYLTRRLVDVAQDCIITEQDCGTENGIELKPVVDSGEVVVSLGERSLGRNTAEALYDPRNGEMMYPANTYIDEDVAVEIDASGLQNMRVRSALTCETVTGVCAACYGRDLARGTKVNMGEAVGVIAAQVIATETNFIAKARKLEFTIVDGDGKELETHKVDYGTRLTYQDGFKIRRGDRLAEWDPYATPILTEVEGTVRLLDIVDGVSAKEETDEETGISSKVIVDWRASSKSGDIQPVAVIEGPDGEPIKLENGNIARYMLAVGAILSVQDGDTVKPGAILARIAKGGATQRDITGGLPRVAELFEARRPKDDAVIADIDGKVEFTRDYKNKRKIQILPEDESLEPSAFLIAKGKHMLVSDGDKVKRGDYLIDGNPAPHDILSIMGVEALAEYLVDEVQGVYRLQGVPINDKHIEVIVRQMLQKVEVSDPGDTTLLNKEQMDKVEFNKVNAALLERDKNARPAEADPVLLGITKASLQTRSFISAASFQETTRVLTEASVQGKEDMLEGLKENVIVGRLIPAGTGSNLRVYQKLANDRDEQFLADKAAAAPQLEEFPAEIEGGDAAE